MIQKRSVATAIVLSIITCGLYSIYWMIVLNDDTNRLCNKTGDMSGGMVFLLTLITTIPTVSIQLDQVHMYWTIGIKVNKQSSK